jgi:hypothetical protein
MAQTYEFNDIPTLKERVVLTDANAILFIFWPELDQSRRRCTHGKRKDLPPAAVGMLPI